MMQRFLLISLLVLFAVPLVNAGEPKNGALQISIKRVFLSEPSGIAPAATETMSEDPAGRILPPAYIAITYEIVNSMPTKKLSLDGSRNTRLTDEYGNEYRKLAQPESFDQPVVRASKSFPSLYPGEAHSETVFFEPPILTARKLKLTVHSKNLGMDRPVELFIDSSDQAVFRTPPKEPEEPLTPSVKIVDPPKGAILKQGEVIHVRVMTVGERPPHKVIVIALNNYFEDKAPGFENVYDLNIPIDQEPANYILNVIAEWPAKGSEESITLSDILAFDVQEAILFPGL